MQHPVSERIRQQMREVPDFPKPGINFYDITTVLKDGPLFQDIIGAFAERYANRQIDAVLGIEARGFIFGASLATSLGVSFIPVRKPGKLPAEVEQVSYALEYGEDSLEMHRDALSNHHRVVIADDLLATGGTAAATAELVEAFGAQIEEFAFVVELSGLRGRDKLQPCSVVSLVKYND